MVKSKKMQVDPLEQSYKDRRAKMPAFERIESHQDTLIKLDWDFPSRLEACAPFIVVGTPIAIYAVSQFLGI